MSKGNVTRWAHEYDERFAAGRILLDWILSAKSCGLTGGASCRRVLVSATKTTAGADAKPLTSSHHCHHGSCGLWLNLIQIYCKELQDLMREGDYSGKLEHQSR